MSSDQERPAISPYKRMNDAVHELLRQYDHGDYTSNHQQQIDCLVRGFRNDLLTTRLELSKISLVDMERHEPERWGLLRILLMIQLFLPYVDSPYAGIQAEVKALFVKANNKDYLQENHDSIQEEIRVLRCALLAKTNTLSVEDQAKHKHERMNLHKYLTQIEYTLQVRD